MKKIIALLLALLCVFSLAACGGKTPDAPEAEPPAAEAPDAETPEPEAPDAETPDAETPDAETPDAETPDAEAPAPEEPEPETPETEVPSNGESLSDMMAAILADVPDLPNVGDIELDETNFEYYLFTSYIEGSEALASEAMIGSIAHSVELLRLPEGADAEAVAESIRTNVNPRKWICVEAEKTEVVVHENVILLVMSFENTADAIVANFNALWA